MSDSNSAILCSFCATLFDEQFKILKSTNETVTFDLSHVHQSPDQFREAITQKCRSCMLRWNQLSGAEQAQIVEVAKKIDLSITIDLEKKHVGIMYAYRLENGGRRAKTIIKTIDLIADEAMAHPVNLHPFHGSTGSENTIELIKWWMDRCDKHHLACMAKQYTHGKSSLPTRLIDVGLGAEHDTRLCRGSELPLGTKYVTLSHCWGDFEPMKLTTQNITELEASIDTPSLPKTFLDAILLTRQLGLRYLWIDSLCIMQDSKSDWQHEALLMKDVYRQAILNIAASSSTDGRGGCFRDREPLLVAPHTIEINWDCLRGEYHLIDRSLWKDEVLDAPLGTRGWVLQERILSTKKVYFGRNQVFWSCQEAVGCEAYPHMLPSLMLETPNVWQNLNMWYDGVQISVWGARQNNRVNERFSPSSYKLWDGIVQTYSALKFTRHTDRLIALAGVAEVVSTMNKDKYVAGLWRSRLPRALIWNVNNPETASRPEPSIVPSWSWASVVGEVTCPGDISEENDGKLVGVISVIEVGTTSIAHNAFGEASSEFIKICGSLVRVIVDADGAHLEFEGWKVANLQCGADVGVFIPGQKLYCLPIFLQAGLCLQLDGSGDGKYRRVGWWATEKAEGARAVATQCRMFMAGTVDTPAGRIREVEADLGDDKVLNRWVFRLV